MKNQSKVASTWDAFLASLATHAPHEEEMLSLFAGQREVVRNTIIKCNSGSQVYYGHHSYSWAMTKEVRVLRIDAEGFHVVTVSRGVVKVPLAILDLSTRDLAKKVREDFREERAWHFKHQLKTYNHQFNKAKRDRDAALAALETLEASHLYMERHTASPTKGK